ncbi:MAG: hypothetical protein ACTHMX_04015 [Thermomicrobiales bacterium]
MPTRLPARTITSTTTVLAACAVALALALLGTIPTFAQHDPRPPALPTATATAPAADTDAATAGPATPAASPVAGGALSLADLRAFSVEGQPVAISPDGKWVAGPGPDRDFCIWDVATLKPQCASDRKPLPVQLETVTWAPDSSAVAFSLDAARLLVDSDIYVMDIDGTLHDLTDDGDNDEVSLAQDAPDVPVDMYPAWSPDSSQLVFARTTWRGDNRSTALYAIGREGGEPDRRLVVSPQEPFVIYSPLHWLDDGTILFSVLHADPENRQNGVWRLTGSGGVERIIAGDETAEIPTPFVNDVSPDGRWATVFSLSVANQFTSDTPAYFIVDLATGETVPVAVANPAPGARIVAVGTFLPDGKSILSVEVVGNRPRLVRSGLDGAALASVDLPEKAVGPASYRGLSITDDGTVFMPTLATEEGSKRGGIIFTVEQP